MQCDLPFNDPRTFDYVNGHYYLPLYAFDRSELLDLLNDLLTHLEQDDSE